MQRLCKVKEASCKVSKRHYAKCQRDIMQSVKRHHAKFQQVANSHQEISDMGPEILGENLLQTIRE